MPAASPAARFITKVQPVVASVGLAHLRVTLTLSRTMPRTRARRNGSRRQKSPAGKQNRTRTPPSLLQFSEAKELMASGEPPVWEMSKEMAQFMYVLTYGFTTYNGLTLAMLWALPLLCDPFPQILAHARATAACTTVGIACCFSAALLVDGTAFPRIAKRLGLTLPAFHVGNILFHILPCALVASWEIATPVSLAHGALAAAIHFGWGMWRSNWTMVLDDIYVSLPRAKWLTLWSVAVAAELLVIPILFGLRQHSPLEANTVSSTPTTHFR